MPEQVETPRRQAGDSITSTEWDGEAKGEPTASPAPAPVQGQHELTALAHYPNW